jgi:N-acetylneuraminic acid mutarotase
VRKSASIFVILLVFSLVLPAFSIPVVRATEDTWTKKAPMQQARAGHGVAVVNGKIYAIGGCISRLEFVNSTEEYDPETDTWTYKASMPTPRSSFGIAVYQKKIYCIGGVIINGSVTGVNEAYDPATDTWETKTSMPTPRFGVEANTVNGKIYLIGGQYTNANEVYDPAMDSWITATPLPVEPGPYQDEVSASVVIDDKIHVMGLAGDGNFHQIYDTETDTWNSGKISVPPYAAAAVTSGVMAPKRIYVFGINTLSWSLDLPQFITTVYDPENYSRADFTSMPTGRIQVGVAVVNDIIYVIGGNVPVFANNVAASNVNEQYTPIEYIPEFPSWIILPLFLMTVLFAVVLKKHMRYLSAT